MDFDSNFGKYLVNFDSDIFEVLKRQEKYKLKTVLVVGNDNEVLGTVSDGDIRRYVLKNNKPPETLSEVIQKDFFRVYDGENIEKGWPHEIINAEFKFGKPDCY